MQRSPLMSLVPVLVLLAIAGPLSGCGGSDNKGTNPVPTTEPFESGNLVNGAIFVHTFNTAGSFSYFCRIHGTGMSGIVNVAPAGVDSPLVTIVNNNFGAPVTVKTGSYVKWFNNGSDHTVTRR